MRERSEKGFPDEPLLAATQTKGVVRKEDYENRTVLALKDLHLLKLVRAGDFVISLRSFQGGIEYARAQGIISPAYTVLYPRDPRLHDYLAWLFKSRPYIDNLSVFVTGIRQGQNIDYQRLGRSELPVPPPDEQAAIVRYLTHHDRRIRRYIRSKRKLIALLQEQEQVLISQAVTGGQVTGARLKPSGIEWPEDIPEHWDVLPLKRVVATKITDGPHETPAFVDEGIDFMSAESMVNGRLDFSRRRGFVSREDHEAYCKKCRPQRNDIFMCKSGATTGKVAIVETDRQFSVWSPLALVRVDRDQALPRFMYAALRAPYIQRQVQDTWSYGTQPNLSMGAMERLMVALPPLAVQRDVVQDMERDAGKIEVSIQRAAASIDLILEYRTRLIADVVTGKLDVRDAAAQVPDDTDEGETIDDVEAFAVDDQPDEEGDLYAAPEEVQA